MNQSLWSTALLSLRSRGVRLHWSMCLNVCLRKCESGWIRLFFDGKAEQCLPSSLLSQSIKWTVSYLKSASLSRTKSCKSESVERLLQRHSPIKHYGKKRKKMTPGFIPLNQTNPQQPNRTTAILTKWVMPVKYFQMVSLFSTKIIIYGKQL